MRPTRYALFAWIAPALLCGWSVLHSWNFWVDDAYISLRYAENLLEHGELVYNLGDRVEGFSNFSLVMLSFLFTAFGLDVFLMLKLFGLGCAIGVVYLTMRLIREVVPRTHHRVAIPVACWLLAFDSSLALWAPSGLETVWFAFLLLASVWRYEREIREDRLPLSALLFGLLWMTRPEAPLYLLYVVVRRLCARKRWTRRDGLWVGLLVLTVVPYEIGGYLYFGQWLPQPFHAKQYTQSLRAFLQQPLVSAFFLGNFSFTVLVAMAIAGHARSRRISTALWVPALCGLVFVLYARVDWMPRLRFFVPVVSFFAALVGVGVAELCRRCSRAWLKHGLAGALACLVIGHGIEEWYVPPAHLSLSPEWRANRPRDALWFLKTPNLQSGLLDTGTLDQTLVAMAMLQPEEAVALRDIGLPGYLRRGPVVDLSGLVTRGTVTKFSPTFRHEGLIDALTRFRPGLIIVSEGYGGLLNWFLETEPRLTPLYALAAEMPFLAQPTPQMVSLNRSRGLPFPAYAAWMRRNLWPLANVEQQKTNLSQQLQESCWRIPGFCEKVPRIVSEWPARPLDTEKFLGRMQARVLEEAQEMLRMARPVRAPLSHAWRVLDTALREQACFAQTVTSR